MTSPAPDSSPLFLWTGVPIGRGVSGACWIAIAGNPRAAIGKRNGAQNASRYTIFNELIAYRVAQRLQLPMPDGFVHKPADAEPFFVQLNFNPETDLPPPVDPAWMVKERAALAARILLFDVFIVNTDRHAGNLAVVRRREGESDVYVYDHSHALLGGGSHDPGPDRLRKDKWLGCDGSVGNLHCLLRLVNSSDQIEAAIPAIEAIPDSLIDAAALEARSCGMTSADSELVVSALQRRRDGIRELIAENRAQFRAITQWGLGV